MWTPIINWILTITQGLGYSGIIVLMAIESSFLPLPSELIIPPAAYLASQGKMSLVLIIITGTLGSVLGATINYLLSRSLGRLVIYKLAAKPWARWFLITPEKISQAEQYFLSNSRSATFFGRLIPVVRHLVSIPAGFSKMAYGGFVAYTAAGALIWVSILTGLGYFIGSNQALLERYYRQISWGLLILGITWIVGKVYNKRKK
ncbi:MAG: DedA family protein [Patescibacteria group bacterium]|jgi:membrane protein DedA with SNARE-associated domain